MGGMCCPSRIEDATSKGPPIDHKRPQEEIEQDEEELDTIKLKIAGGMSDMFYKINKRRKQVDLFNQKFREDILNGKWTVLMPIESIPCGIVGKETDLDDDIGKAYFSRFSQEVMEYCFDAEDGGALRSSQKDLHDEIGLAYYSRFTKELLEYQFAPEDRYAKYGDYTDLQDDWFAVYLQGISHCLEMVEYCWDCDEGE